MTKTKEADLYIARSKSAAAYRHTYHIMPPVGWMNDPNGFSYALGKYHFFYQFHPYAAAWGPMHWGHYTSEDLIKWELAPTALAPDEPYDKDGCFSGSAIEREKKLYLLYTAVSGALQQQALALSEDGVTFRKKGLVISEKDLPRDASKTNFRDPKVFEKDGFFYAVIGSKHSEGAGQVLLYRSRDLENWEYAGCPWRTEGDELMCECPDYVRLGEKDLLLSSIQFLHRDGWRNENVHTARYLTGERDFGAGKFYPEIGDEVDSGFDFYAPQTLVTPDGRTVMIAWMQMWDRTYVTAPYGWVGATTLPRELSLKNGRLVQTPVRELEKYRKNPVKAENIAVLGERAIEGVRGTKCEISFTLDLGTAKRAGVKLFCGHNLEAVLFYDRASELVLFDRSNTGTLISGSTRERDALIRRCAVRVKENRIKFRLFLDVSSLEVFLNDGERTMTGLVYAPQDADGVVFFAEGGTAKIAEIEKYDIVL